MESTKLAKRIIWPEAGTYVVAVSGGVDSTALLDLLINNQEVYKWQLIVSHFDHGIRIESAKDMKFVHDLATSHQLPFEPARVELGNRASEAAARQARYQFLRSIKRKYQANAIITAHHLDDKLETALLNIERGTGRQGLTPFRRSPDILRPLKNVYKKDLLAYAKARSLRWKTDSTNYDLRYHRNYVRHIVIPALEREQANFKPWLSRKIKKLEFENYQFDKDLRTVKLTIGRSIKGGIELNRSAVIMMSQRVAQEFLHLVISEQKAGIDITSAQIHRLVHFCKTAKTGRTLQIGNGLRAVAGYDRVTLTQLT